MNRREVLIGTAALCAAVPVAADCRDDKGMPGPEESSDLLMIDVRRPVVQDERRVKEVARALFGFGAYEDLLKHHKEKTRHNFRIYGEKAAMQVTSLDVDFNPVIGCIVCVVRGRLYRDGVQ